MKRYDVAVIGGGPIGSQVAYRLAQAGYGVVVIDKKDDLGEKVCCAGIVSRECVSSFDVAPAVILRQANSATVISPSGKSFRVWRQEAQACIIDRAEFNMAMARRARDGGAEYTLGSEVKNIKINDDRVTVEAIQMGEGVCFEASAAVIATGFGSNLPQGLGMSKVGDFIAGAQAEVDAIGVNEVEVYLGQEVAPGFFAWLVPSSPSKALVGLMSRCRPGFYLRKLMASLKGQGKIASDDVEPGYRGVSLKPPAKTYGDRLVVVGDAAGQVKPTTGGGIYFGLLCADMAAASLNQALQNGDLSARALAGYERSWKKKLAWELKVGYWARKLYERLSDAQIDRVIDIIKDRGIDEALAGDESLSFDWHGGIILGLIRRQVLSKIGVRRLPFSLGREVGDGKR